MVSKTFSTSEAAALLSVSVETIRDLIKARQLKPINAAVNPKAKRPTYRIDEVEIERFKKRRTVGGFTTEQPTKEKTRKSEVYDYFAYMRKAQ